MTLIAGLRVVEVEGRFGDACARLLESLGATVTRVAEATRATEIEALAGAADVLIESRGLDLTLPQLVHVSITPFGRGGPYATFRGGELVCAALGGVLRFVGDPDRAPVKEALDACSFHAQTVAAAAALVAVWERAASGCGQRVDVSIQEVAASRLTNAVLLWQFDRRKLERSGNRLKYGRASVRCIWQLRDGYVFHSLMSGRFGAPANAALSEWLDADGCDNPLRGVDWLAYDRSALPEGTRAVWEAAIDHFFRRRTKAEIETEGVRRGINAAIVAEPADVLADPQLAARKFWALAEREGKTVRVPGSFLQLTAADPVPAARSGGRARTSTTGGALAGVNVLDLSWALVGSFATKALADHGACVVKVESAKRLCLTRLDVQVARSKPGNYDDKPWFAQLNTGKCSLRLDLKHPRAREVLDPLIQWSDVVVENFSPGTLDKLGLGYEALRVHKPDVILVSGSAYGQTGPRAQSWGVDGTSGALSSRTWLTGWPDRGPVLPGAVPYADAVVPQVMVAALVAALLRRRQTGAGCHIDASMYEISVQQMRRALIDAQLGRAPQRRGNRDPDVWHQGVYPARGVDRWIAISLFGPDDYRRLTEALGGDWPEPDDAFDLQLAAYTREREDEALMQLLQAAGIAAGVVRDVEQLFDADPQLRARQTWVRVDHPVLGPFAHQTTPYHLARTPALLSPAPRLGEHDAFVCRELLGFDRAHYEALIESGVFT